MNVRTSCTIGCCMMFAAAALAQSTGSISGTVVSDQGGLPVPTASIQAKDVAGASSSATTAVDGTFTLASLPPGAYDVSIEVFPFFLPFRAQKVQVQAGKTTRLDARLLDVTMGTLGDGGADFARLLTPKPAPKGPTPRTREGKPDLSGVWRQALPAPVGEPARPLPWAEAIVRKHVEDEFKDVPSAHCLPFGVSMGGFFSDYRIVQTPDLVVIIDENSDPARQIYLDGRGHPREFLLPSYMGHSIGHWEGDTLVVDTTGFNDRGSLTFVGFPQTEKLRVTERFRRPDLGHLEVEVTFDDPGAFQKPWTMKRVSSLAPKNWELSEYICTENNRDLQHLVGK